MRVTFAARPRTTITLTRASGETMALDLEALPPGYGSFLQTVYPPPRLFLNGQPGAVNPDREGRYWEHVAALQVAKGLESSGVLETAPPTDRNAKAWEGYAEAVLAEFAAAGLTDDEVATLHRELMALGKAHIRSSDSGNSASPSRG